MEDEKQPPASAPLSPTVKALGAVSFCADVSSEMVYPANPGFITRTLGAPAWVVGLIEGIAESTASLVKLYSGSLSDASGRRKPLTAAGYSLSAVAKPLIAVAPVWGFVLAARFLDRFGKGLRTAPRDALIAESTPEPNRGRAFGLHRGMDTAGAVTGPLLGYLYLRAHPEGIRSLYLVAFLPALLGILILLFFVREARRLNDAAPARAQFSPPAVWKGLSPEYRRYLAIVALFSAGNSSDAFLILRAQGMGVAATEVLLLYAAFNIAEAVLAYSAGGLSDRVGRRPLLIAGYTVFAGVYLGFAVLRGAEAAWGLFILYGLYYTLTQGTQRALAADLAHPDRRATELGAFHMVLGVAALPASFAAGLLYAYVSPIAPFAIGASAAAAAAVLLARTA